MQYPMPENMGFTRPTLTDLLPEEIAEADMAAIQKHVQREKMGLHEYVCAGCKKRFTGTIEHAYKIVHKGYTKRFCSYTCFAPAERAERERFRRQTLGKWADRKDSAQPQSDAAYCRKKLEAWTAKEQDPAFAALKKERQWAIRRNIAKWRAALVLAEEREREREKEVG